MEARAVFVKGPWPGRARLSDPTDKPRRCRRIRPGASAGRRSRPLRHQHADHGVLAVDRRGHEGDRRAARGPIGREVSQAGGRLVSVAGAVGDCQGEVRLLEGAAAQRGGEIDFLLHALDDAAGRRIGQPEVEEAEGLGGVAQQRVEDRVLLAVGADVAGIVDQLAPLGRERVGDEVVVCR